MTVPDSIPEKLDYDYLFLEKIGEGANGETWLARHRFENRLAAIKCLKLDKIDDIKTIELFERESELLKSVHVDGVPLFFDYYSPANNGRGYLVQEYIQAPSVQSLLDQNGVFTESQTLGIAERIAEILYHLESEYQPPIIHRDIKPSNILYRASDGMVYLIDFGAVANPQKRTGGSTVAGTFGYMAPEQIMGNVEIQSDYYALGATMLHMIIGVPPYELDSELFKIDIERAFADKQVHVSQKMKNLLSMLLSPEIDKRPQNGLELMNAIRSVRELKHSQKRIWSSLGHYLLRAVAWIFPIRTRSRSYSDSNDTSRNLLTIQQIEEHNLEYEECSFVTRTWVRCDGMIRHYKSLKTPKRKEYCNALEYTFEVQNTVWCGFCMVRDISKLSINFPAKCSVLYNPADPAENGLEFIY